MSKLSVVCISAIFVILNVLARSIHAETNEKTGVLDCLYETNGLACVKKHADAELNRIETEVTGRKSSIGFSQVLEEAGALMVDGTRSLFGIGDVTPADNENAAENVEEARSDAGQARKRLGKKKKKLLQKLIAFSMMIKAKLGLLMQIISTHVQLKFFAVAVISLLLNIARFWVDLKKSHQPQKVIYYEHAQHQHHYDNDDEHGYWGRSAIDNTPAQQMAYDPSQHQ